MLPLLHRTAAELAARSNKPAGTIDTPRSTNTDARAQLRTSPVASIRALKLEPPADRAVPGVGKGSQEQQVIGKSHLESRGLREKGRRVSGARVVGARSSGTQRAKCATPRRQWWRAQPAWRRSCNHLRLLRTYTILTRAPTPRTRYRRPIKASYCGPRSECKQRVMVVCVLALNVMIGSAGLL